MSVHPHELDQLDYLILQYLMNDAGIPYSEIAKELNVSGGTIHVRMKKMQDAGIVTGTRLIVNPAALGFDICAFIGVYLERGSHYRETVDKLKEVREIVELHYTTGIYNIFCKIVCRDTRHLRQILNDQVQAIPGVQRTETFISLEQSIHRELSLNPHEQNLHSSQPNR
jgi:Lrp/AsnC family transcriptional regulator for asnA, asnC and gidA